MLVRILRVQVDPAQRAAIATCGHGPDRVPDEISECQSRKTREQAASIRRSSSVFSGSPRPASRSSRAHHPSSRSRWASVPVRYSAARVSSRFGSTHGNSSAISRLRRSIAATKALRNQLSSAAKTRAASTFGVGPRYLHSTGQYHKGGPNTALVFLITGDDRTATEIPGAGYSFSVLKRAQALGDYETLAAHGRRVVRLHVTGEDPAGVLIQLFDEALS